MTYRKRIKEVKSRKLDSWHIESIQWLKEQGRFHQGPYLKGHFREKCDVHSGKYIGWSDGLTKDKGRQLKRSIRMYSSKICLQGIDDYHQELWDERYDVLEG